MGICLFIRSPVFFFIGPSVILFFLFVNLDTFSLGFVFLLVLLYLSSFIVFPSLYLSLRQSCLSFSRLFTLFSYSCFLKCIFSQFCFSFVFLLVLFFFPFPSFPLSFFRSNLFFFQLIFSSFSFVFSLFRILYFFLSVLYFFHSLASFCISSIRPIISSSGSYHSFIHILLSLLLSCLLVLSSGFIFFI